MNILDDKKIIDKYDSKNCLLSIDYLAKQIQTSWNNAKKVSLPKSYKNISSIIFCGMGGSSYAARIIKYLYAQELKLPIDIINDYNLPLFANENSLVIAASYSGNTEETISCTKQALRRKCKVIGISSGGMIAQMLQKNSKPIFVFSPKFNPSNQPRLGQGYMQAGQIAFLDSLDLIRVSQSSVDNILETMQKTKKELQFSTSQDKNNAKKLALLMEQKIVNLIGGEFLKGAIHSIRNPIHETGKHFANYFTLPEVNHHLMEGLKFPSFNKNSLIFGLIDSELYSQKIKTRLLLTKEVIEKNNIKTFEINLSFKDKLGQVFELIQLGSYISFYLAMLHKMDPSKIPWVDFFKNKLKTFK